MRTGRLKMYRMTNSVEKSCSARQKFTPGDTHGITTFGHVFV